MSPHGPPKSVQDQVRALDAELIEDAGQVPCVAAARVVELAGLAGGAVARHVRRDGPRELAGPRHKVLPVLLRPGFPCTNTTALAR